MTVKQRKVAKIVEKHGSFKEAMVKAGYSPNTAKNPRQNLTSRKGWNVLLEQHLPDSDLLTATKDGLKADKLVALPDEPNVVIPDHAIRLKAAEQGYKLKGRYQDGTTNNVQVNNYIDVAQKQREKYGE